MGCICSKSGENSNVNLDPLKSTHIKVNKLDLANQNENTTNNVLYIPFKFILIFKIKK